jgi:hypothetical protein
VVLPGALPERARMGAGADHRGVGAVRLPARPSRPGAGGWRDGGAHGSVLRRGAALPVGVVPAAARGRQVTKPRFPAVTVCDGLRSETATHWLPAGRADAAREAALPGDIGSVAQPLEGVTYRGQIERAKEVHDTKLLSPRQTWHSRSLSGADVRRGDSQ